MARGKESTNQLALVPLFSALSKSDLQQVDRAADRIEVEAGRELVTEGRTGREFFLILDGTAIVRRNGRKVATLGPGQFFGELSLLDKGPRTATVVAESDMKLLVLGQREFGGLIDGVPGMAAKLLQGLAHRLREADARTVS